MKQILIALTAVLMISSARAGIGSWKNFTAMNSVRAVASANDSVWAATSGGAFLCTVHDSSFVRFTNSEGLSTNDLTAVAIDRSGTVWFGQANGSIDIYSPATGRWRYIRDIAIADRSQKAITSFCVLGDSMYIGSSFGVSLFSISRFRFIDTYANFGREVTPPVLSVCADGARIFAATANGIAVSKPGAINPAAPESWEQYIMPDAVTSLAIVQGKIYAGAASGLFEFAGTNWISKPAASQPVKIVGQTGELLYFTRDKTLFSYSNGVVQQLGTRLDARFTSGTIASGTPVFGTDSLGLARLETGTDRWKISAPNGPASNSFVSMAVDKEGVIWAASGRSNGHGFYSFDGGTWTNYSKANIPGLRYDECFGVAIGPNNSKWISTWGAGLVLMNAEGRFERIYDHITPGFVGIENNLQYIVPAVVGTDKDGNVWTSIYASADLSKVIWKMEPDGKWTSYPAPLIDYNKMLGVVTDHNDTKWFTNQLPGFPAEAQIVFMNEKGTVSGTAEGYGTLPEKNGITSSIVFSIVEDREGILWMGTTAGIITIGNTIDPIKSASKVELGAVREQYINCIAVDALNNKWLGTSHGVLVLSPDGTSLIDQYTVAGTNGKLVDDNIYSIAFDQKNGIAYFGTEKGLSSVGIQIVEPAANYSGMSVYPNPFRPGMQPFVTIEGLAEGSTVKILTVNASLVRQFPAQGGGRAFWDGKTETGETVASGIYIAVAYNALGGQVGIAKVAVIRK